ncbi:hypothetical protein BTHE68_63440 (plasmid) [Burkholderia sp. THE68]|uniref:hypothetical protein n=1 Tax=Burkholderia sp. THE68 TaxID=758782 RepID=UPI0013183E60|nr:hypothetical protein [Burkholderia sp. THE68]BBU32610.1 hypothetical protein BTHE68_63440 [Burkholderia sp. THE68]
MFRELTGDDDDWGLRNGRLLGGEESCMPIWRARSFNEVSRFELLQWRILAIDKGTTHFVGRDARNHHGGVSSAIVSFDKLEKRGMTISALVYQFVGAPGFAGVAEHVWSNWCLPNKVRNYRDVTCEASNFGGHAERRWT